MLANVYQYLNNYPYDAKGTWTLLLCAHSRPCAPCAMLAPRRPCFCVTPDPYIPPGWTHWYTLWGNSKYYNFTLQVGVACEAHCVAAVEGLPHARPPGTSRTLCAVHVHAAPATPPPPPQYNPPLRTCAPQNDSVTEKHGDVYEDDYLTDLVSKRALRFLQGPLPKAGPFFMFLAPPAAHAPFAPAPQVRWWLGSPNPPTTHPQPTHNPPTTHPHPSPPRPAPPPPRFLPRLPSHVWLPSVR
jgi:hypothetical protein